MKTLHTQANRQAEALGVITLALVAVLAYSVWGAYMLHQERFSQAKSPAVADLR